MLKREEIYDPDSTWNKTADDEPVFVLRAKDPLAPAVVGEWIRRACEDGLHVSAKLDEAEQLAEKMVTWRRRWMKERPERQPQKDRPGMSITEALWLGKENNKAIRRKTWPAGVYLQCDETNVMTIGSDDSRSPMSPDETILLADDWEEAAGKPYREVQLEQMAFSEVLYLWRHNATVCVSRVSWIKDGSQNNKWPFVMYTCGGDLRAVTAEGVPQGFYLTGEHLMAMDWIVVPKERQFGSHAANTCASGFSANKNSKTEVGE